MVLVKMLATVLWVFLIMLSLQRKEPENFGRVKIRHNPENTRKEEAVF